MTDTYASSDQTLTVPEIEDLWVQAGGDPAAAPLMAAIAIAESSGHTGVLNDNPNTKDYSVGLWQINYYGDLMPGRTSEYGTPESLRADPLAQAKAAVALFAGGQGIGNWKGDAAYKAWQAGESLTRFGVDDANVPTPNELQAGIGAQDEQARRAGVRVDEPPPPDAQGAIDQATASDLDGLLASQAPALAAELSDPQVKALLAQWAQGNLSDTQFQTQLEATDWWRNTPLSKRQQLVAQATDPATLQQRIAQQGQLIDTAAKQMGVGLPGGTEYQLAEQSVAQGWDNATIQRKLAQFYQAGSTQAQTGQAGDVTQQIQALYDDYALPSSPSDIGSKVRQVLAGTQNVDDFKTMLADQAKSLYGNNPNLASALDRGQTVAQYMSTYATIAANLGVVADPSQIDWLDPKWNVALTGSTDPKTGVFQAMSPLQWQQKLQTDPVYGYWKTAHGIDTAAQIGQTLKDMFAGQGSVG